MRTDLVEGGGAVVQGGSEDPDWLEGRKDLDSDMEPIQSSSAQL